MCVKLFPLSKFVYICPEIFTYINQIFTDKTNIIVRKYNQKSMPLSKKAIKSVKKSKKCRERLCAEMKYHPGSIRRMLREGSIILTTAQALKIISEETGIPIDKILIP